MDRSMAGDALGLQGAWIGLRALQPSELLVALIRRAPKALSRLLRRSRRAPHVYMSRDP